jgi:hypothetical protein
MIAPFNGLRAPVNLYWTSFNGALAWYNSLLLIGYLAIIAIGLGAAWRRWKWAGLMPLAFNLGYALANGIGRFSGWRYDLPADWIAYFYFGVGFAEILLWLAKVLGARFLDLEPIEKVVSAHHKQNLAIQLIPFATIFALIGALPWIAESVNPRPRYSDLPPAAIQEQIASLPAVQAMGIFPGELQVFANRPEAIMLTGRLLYPRYFGQGAGISSTTPWQSYAPRDFPRLGFLLINQRVYEVILPIKGSPVGKIHGEDTLILGCVREGYIEARILAFPNTQLVYLSDLALDSCGP